MRFRVSVCVSVFISHILALSLLIPAIGYAASDGVVISGLQTAGKTNAADEFIELSNLSATDVSLAGWQIQYRSATATNGNDCTKGWVTKATVAKGGTVAAGGNYLFAPASYLDANTSFSAGLAAAGTVRLLDNTKAVVDALAWGSATCGMGAPAKAPAAGQSLERHAGAEGAHGDNALDFSVAAPAGGEVAGIAAPVTETPAANPAATPASTPVPGVGSAGGKLEITELLVDPVAPKNDSDDEFVEVHNPGDAPVDATGYAVRSGSHTVKLPAGPIAPDGYVVITSADTTISLSNSGGVANLLDPEGNVIDTAGAWGTAEPGASWANIDGTWLWTLTPTPGQDNEYTAVPGTAGADDSTVYDAVELSELLPDPASPLTDAADEYIELYNPNDQPVGLAGYVIKVGHDLGSKYVIKDGTIPAGGYFTLKSSLTKLALSNDGSSVALYTPNGAQLGSTVTYPKAAAGNAWANINGNWDWTAQPSPGAANVAAAVETAAAAAAKAKAAKAAKAKAAAKPKTTKAKAAAKPKAAKASKTTKPLLAGTTTAGGRWLLYILAGLTIGYIIYEFRYDIRNYYYKLRGYPVGGAAPVPVLAEASDDRAIQRSGRR